MSVLQTMNWEETVVSSLLLLLLLSTAVYCRYFYFKIGTLIFGFLGIIIIDVGYSVPSLWVRSAFALGSLL